jgi:hypothetical protein
MDVLPGINNLMNSKQEMQRFAIYLIIELYMVYPCYGLCGYAFWKGNV